MLLETSVLQLKNDSNEEFLRTVFIIYDLCQNQSPYVTFAMLNNHIMPLNLYIAM